MIIELSKEEIKKCEKFSFKCAKNQQEIEFGQTDTVPRNIKEIGRDNFIGKLTEVAFAKMLAEKYDIHVKLDFEYYPRGEWDGQDTIINDWKIDVKGTRKGGKWMLVEWSKINFRQRDKDLSHLFVMGSVHWDRETDLPTGKVELVGCASILKLKNNVDTTKILRKGSLLPDTQNPVHLQADNFGIKFKDLNKDWDFIINYILENKPPELDNYPNPYTGETYKDLFPNDFSDKLKNTDGDEMAFEDGYKKESRISNIIKKFYNKEKEI